MQTSLRCHLCDIAPPVSAAVVRARLREGWQIGRLPFGIASTGGLEKGDHAVVSPNGKALRISDTTLQHLTLLLTDPLPEIEVDSTVLALNVPFSEKEEAKAAGARWSGQHRRWYIPPGVTCGLEAWAPSTPQPICLLQT